MSADHRFTSADKLVDETIQRVGEDIRLATPLGLGKPVQLLNAFYRRARQDPSITLTVMTALNLSDPDPGSELERRLVEPVFDRINGDYPELQFERDLRDHQLPDNVAVKEFYFIPGSKLSNAHAQQHHFNTNFTHVVRDLLIHDVNVIAQLISPARSVNGKEPMHSLSCNADLTLDLLDALDREPRISCDYVLLGQVNRNLPFMYGDCLTPTASFDGILDDDTLDFDLFGSPNQPVDDVEYAIGMHVSRLVQDGGTLQIGIGSLSDAVSRMLILRHRQNDIYRELIDAFSTSPVTHEERLVDEVGGHDQFTDGLYGATEMLVPGFHELYKQDILSRKVYDHTIIQQYVNEHDHRVTPKLLDRLVDAGTISDPLQKDELNFLKQYGIIREDVQLENHRLKLPDRSASVPANLSDPEVQNQLKQHNVLHDTLSNGRVAHAGFFLGPPDMYEFLRNMDDEERRKIAMSRISFVNDLYDDQVLAAAQRRDARFINSAMKVTLSGAVVSDGLEDMRVVSGVGGQYNFVSMAHQLRGARSIIMLPSTRESGGKVTSNIVWNYGHTTIPRHLRDIVVTEYGAVDLRGRSDREIVEGLLSITDARFQDELLEQAKDAQKLPSDWTMPDAYRSNTPEKIEQWAKKGRKKNLLKPFPFGTELTEDEQVIGRALKTLKSSIENWDFTMGDLGKIPTLFNPPSRLQPYLERMDLDEPSSWKEWGLQKALLLGLLLRETN